MRQLCRPFDSGEVIVQSYNTLLTLQHLHGACDAVILAENSALHRTCQRMLNIPRPSLQVPQSPLKFDYP